MFLMQQNMLKRKRKRYFDGTRRLTLNRRNKQRNEIIKTLVEWSSLLLGPYKKNDCICIDRLDPF